MRKVGEVLEYADLVSGPNASTREMMDDVAKAIVRRERERHGAVLGDPIIREVWGEGGLIQRHYQWTVIEVLAHA